MERILDWNSIEVIQPVQPKVQDRLQEIEYGVRPPKIKSNNGHQSQTNKYLSKWEIRKMPFVKQVIWYKNSPRNLGSKKERFDDIFEKGREKGTNESRTVGTTFYEIPKQWYLRHAKVDYTPKLTTGKCVENIQNKSWGCSQSHQRAPDVKIVKVFAARLAHCWVFIIWEWGQIGSIHMLIATIKHLGKRKNTILDLQL